VDTFPGRVTKAHVLQAVTEAKGKRAAYAIEHLKKGEMAARAETLLAGSGWLPEPLRTPGRDEGTKESAGEETAEKSSAKELEDDEQSAADNEDAGGHVIAA